MEIVYTNHSTYSGHFPRSASQNFTPNPIEEELKDIKDALASVSEYHSATVEALEVYYNITMISYNK